LNIISFAQPLQSVRVW